MDCAVEPFQNRDNYAKYQLFYYEPGTTVFIQSLRWLYMGKQPIEYHLADLVQNSNMQKKYNINETQKLSLLGLRMGTVQLNELDLSLLYKLIQNVCGLGAYDSITNLWNSKCAPNRQDGLEFLFYTLKTGRNKLAHPSPQLKNLTDEDVDRKCEEMKTLLTSIIQKAGEKANIDNKMINEVVTHVINDLERIRQDKYAAKTMTLSTKKMVLRDLQKWYDKQSEESVIVKIGKEIENFLYKKFPNHYTRSSGGSSQVEAPSDKNFVAFVKL